jgi:MFS family permease
LWQITDMAQDKTDALNPQEIRAATSLASVYALRMFGLFLVLPVLAVYAQQYPDYSKWLVGLAIGAYGLTQATLQIPMGWLSDRIGRKPVIVAGLAVFALGSWLAASAETLTVIVLGRALQGAGAIAAALMALAADLSRDEVRSKIMAAMGMSIGAAFILALMAGPLLAPLWGLSGLFAITGALAILAIGVVLFWVPDAKRVRHLAEVEVQRQGIRRVLMDSQLLRLNAGIFTLHFVLSAVFASVPLDLVNAGFAREKLAWVYVPVMLGSFALMLPAIIMAEKGRRHVPVMRLAIVFLLAAQVLWMTTSAGWLVVTGLLLFFVGFNALESMLPSVLSRVAPAASKGTALGVYSTSQFLGSFFGGASAGWLLSRGGHGPYLAAAALLAGWLLLTAGLRNPEPVATLYLYLDTGDDGRSLQRLSALQGVMEVVRTGEGAVLVRYHKERTDETSILQAVEAQRA